VAVSVPGERGDAIARADSERSERVGQLPRATMQLAVGRAVKIALDAARDDLEPNRDADPRAGSASRCSTASTSSDSESSSLSCGRSGREKSLTV